MLRGGLISRLGQCSLAKLKLVHFGNWSPSFSSLWQRQRRRGGCAIPIRLPLEDLSDSHVAYPIYDSPFHRRRSQFLGCPFLKFVTCFGGCRARKIEHFFDL